MLEVVHVRVSLPLWPLSFKPLAVIPCRRQCDVVHVCHACTGPGILQHACRHSVCTLRLLSCAWDAALPNLRGLNDLFKPDAMHCGY